MVLKLYLDLCVYNRPFDYQGQERVALETSAFIYLLEKVEKGINRGRPYTACLLCLSLFCGY